MIQQRTDLFEVIAALAERYPHWRVGQLIANIAEWADRDIWDVEDEQLLEAAQSHLQQRSLSPPATQELNAAGK